MKYVPLSSRELPDAAAEQTRREHMLAILELRREIESLKRRVEELETP